MTNLHYIAIDHLPDVEEIVLRSHWNRAQVALKCLQHPDPIRQATAYLQGRGLKVLACFHRIHGYGVLVDEFKEIRNQSIHSEISRK